MPRQRAAWSDIVYSYPCPDCDAPPGANCRTRSGTLAGAPHTARVTEVDRCQRCDQWLPAEAGDQGLDLCPRCLDLVT